MLIVYIYYSGINESDFLTDLIGPVVDEIIDYGDNSLSLSPMTCYKDINDSNTVKTTMAGALQDPAVLTELTQRTEVVLKIASTYMERILRYADMFPYCVRYYTKVLRDAFIQQFPDASVDELNNALRYIDVIQTNYSIIVYSKFLIHCITQPEKFELVKEITTIQRNNLMTVWLRKVLILDCEYTKVRDYKLYTKRHRRSSFE